MNGNLFLCLPQRYLAVTRPLTYSKRRRSKRLAMLMILIVWVLALAITCPPILGTLHFINEFPASVCTTLLHFSPELGKVAERKSVYLLRDDAILDAKVEIFDNNFL